MSREDRFTFIVNDAERQMIAQLADYLQRTQSDAVRFVIRRAIAALPSESTSPPDQPKRSAQLPQVQHDGAR